MSELVPHNPNSDLELRREAPLSPRLRWLEVVSKTALELYQARYRVRLLTGIRDEKARHGPYHPSVFHGFERDPLARIAGFVTEDMGWQITHNPDLPQVRPDDRLVYMVNHPTLTAAFAWGHFMSEHFAENMVAVVKSEFITNPFFRFILGDTMQKAEKGIFIDRGDRKKALQTISDESIKLLTPGTGAIIMPDAHRPYPKRLREEIREWREKFPHLDVESWMTGTCFPRSDGLWALARATAGLDRVRILDCTVAEPRVTQQFGGLLHIDVREISREELFGDPEDLEYLRKKLVELWMRKNELIRGVRAEG